MAQRILSIDGGGTRGIIPATILDCIHKEFGKTPLDLFDLFAGTSTGGIICIGLAAGLPPSALVDLYLNRSGDIFHESFLDRLQGLDEHLQADYQNKRLKKILDSLFGDKTLGDLHIDPNFGGKNKRLMVTSFDLSPEDSTENKNYRPVIFHSSFIKCATTTLKDLALMTSAGPTYFPVYNQQYIDGGVALNNPAMAAIAFAINGHTNGVDYLYPDGKRKGLGLQQAELKLFSLSTGTGNKNRVEKSQVKGGNWGDIQWIKYLPDLITESNMQSTMYYVKQILADEQVQRIELFFDDPIAPEILKIKPPGLDAKDPGVLAAMHQFAKDTYLKHKAEIAAFLELA